MINHGEVDVQIPTVMESKEILHKVRIGDFACSTAVKTGVTISSIVTSQFGDRVRFLVTKVKYADDGEPDGGGIEPGQPTRYPDVVVITAYSNEPNAMAILGDSIGTLTINGYEFVPDYTSFVNSTAWIHFPPKGGAYFSAEGGDLLGTELTYAEMDYAAVLAPNPAHLFMRWDKYLEYIGADFNVDLFSLDHGLRRFHYARFKYRTRAMKSTETRYEFSPEPEPDPNGYNYDEPHANKPPHGACMAAKITYNAVSKTVRVDSYIDGSSVTFRVNATIWFTMNMLLLLPVSVI
jgi:hypothetical protein